MAKKRSAKKESTEESPSLPEKKKKAVPKQDATEQAPSVRDRIQTLLDELTDAELNILLYEIENPQETRSIRKLARIASSKLKRPKAIKELTEMALDYNIERHPRRETHYLTDRYHLREYFYEYCM